MRFCYKLSNVRRTKNCCFFLFFCLLLLCCLTFWNVAACPSPLCVCMNACARCMGVCMYVCEPVFVCLGNIEYVRLCWCCLCGAFHVVNVLFASGFGFCSYICYAFLLSLALYVSASRVWFSAAVECFHVRFGRLALLVVIAYYE